MCTCPQPDLAYRIVATNPPGGEKEFEGRWCGKCGKPREDLTESRLRAMRATRTQYLNSKQGKQEKKAAPP